MTILETPRLRVRELEACDEAELRALLGDPDVMRHYAAWRGPEAGARWARGVRAIYARHGYGPWTVELRDGTFVGQCGPVPQVVEGTHETEMICFFARPFWRHGYADEAGAACTAYVVARFGCARPIALVGLHNRPSLRLAKRHGFSYERDVVMDGLPMALLRRGPPAGP